MAVRSVQRGMSFVALIFILAVLAAVGAVGMKALPTFLEYQAIVKAVDRAKVENTVAGVRNAFDRSAQVDNITSISGKDLTVTRENDQTVVSFSYEKEIPMAGPAWLLLKYEGRSRPGR